MRLLQQQRAADGDLAAVNGRGHPTAGLRGERLSGGQRQPPVGGGGHDRAGQRMLAGLLGGGGQGQELLLGQPGGGQHVHRRDPRGALGQRAGLSNPTAPVCPSCSITTADYTSTPCRPRR